MALTVTAFNVLLIPFIAIYLLHKNDCGGFRLSGKIIIEYFVITCVIGVAAKGTAMLIANIFLIIIYHYESAYSVIALAWALIVAFFIRTIMQNYITHKEDNRR